MATYPEFPGMDEFRGDGPTEGDITTWHIRLWRRVGDIESWQLYRGEAPMSSGSPKETVQKWCDEELAKESR